MIARRAVRLADWIEGLGLVPHLAEAGLPSLERAPDGSPVWRDPLTGEVLDEAQLADLDVLLHREGEDPRHAVPVPLLQLATLARRRSALLETEWLSYELLAQRRGASVEATRFAVHKAVAEQRLLVVPLDVSSVVPAFQLDGAGDVRLDLVPVLAMLLGAGMDPWRVWAWLTQPAALLGGLVPERALAAPEDPEDPALVAGAARALADRVNP